MEGFKRHLLTVCGIGLLPRGRGTAGTAAGLVLFLAARHWGGGGPWLVPAAGALAAGAVLVFLGPWCEAHFSRKDPQEVVLDEVAGIFFTFFGVQNPSSFQIAAGFVLFRVFDIVKPFPARLAERLPAGWGILCDDLVAALYANLLLHGWQTWGIA